jgi:ubiquinone/menaquinone biosynthesis C-methylase UbiE
MHEPLYGGGAVGYDEAFARVARSFVPNLLKAARIAPGHHVLDVATGTGVAAQAAASLVGRSGLVIGGDTSSAMLDVARINLKDLPIILETLDAHALPYEDGRFHAVICQLGLMLFADPAGALAEFRRVLRPNGWTAVSVTTTPERSLFARVGAVIGRHVPEKADRLNRFFALGEPNQLETLLRSAGFDEVCVQLETRGIQFSSFDDYFGGIAQGATLSGQEYVQLPADVQMAVCEEVWRGLGSPHHGEPLVIEMDVLIGSGRR